MVRLPAVTLSPLLFPFAKRDFFVITAKALETSFPQSHLARCVYPPALFENPLAALPLLFSSSGPPLVAVLMAPLIEASFQGFSLSRSNFISLSTYRPPLPFSCLPSPLANWFRFPFYRDFRPPVPFSPPAFPFTPPFGPFQLPLINLC